MTDRDRLINELKKSKNRCLIHESGGCLACKHRGQADCTLENLADHLLENGVIMPPCKVGDKVYLPNRTDWGTIEYYEITEFVFDGEQLYFVVDDEDRETHQIEEIGKTVFLTKEEAEEKLKEREQNA